MCTAHCVHATFGALVCARMWINFSWTSQPMQYSTVHKVVKVSTSFHLKFIKNANKICAAHIHTNARTSDMMVYGEIVKSEKCFAHQLSGSCNWKQPVFKPICVTYSELTEKTFRVDHCCWGFMDGKIEIPTHQNTFVRDVMAWHILCN